MCGGGGGRAERWENGGLVPHVCFIGLGVGQPFLHFIPRRHGPLCCRRRGNNNAHATVRPIPGTIWILPASHAPPSIWPIQAS